MDSVVFVPSVASTEWLSGLFPDYSLAELPVAGRRIVDYVLEVAQKSGAMLVEVLDWHYTKRLEDYFNDGPLPRDVKERDFREGVLAGKFLKMEVEDKIKVTGQEIKSRTDELMRINLMTTKPGEKPRYKTDHKSVIALIRSERYARGVRELYKSLYATAQVVSPEYPELEKVEGVIPEKKTTGVKRP